MTPLGIAISVILSGRPCISGVLCSARWKDTDFTLSDDLTVLTLCGRVRGSGDRSLCDGGEATTISIGMEDILVK